jgi:hypothetical protein
MPHAVSAGDSLYLIQLLPASLFTPTGLCRSLVSVVPNCHTCCLPYLGLSETTRQRRVIQRSVHAEPETGIDHIRQRHSISETVPERPVLRGMRWSNFEKFENFQKIKKCLNCPKDAQNQKKFEKFHIEIFSKFFKFFWCCALSRQFPAFFDFSEILKLFNLFSKVS